MPAFGYSRRMDGVADLGRHPRLRRSGHREGPDWEEIVVREAGLPPGRRSHGSAGDRASVGCHGILEEPVANQFGIEPSVGGVVDVLIEYAV